ncbi:MAG TPA: chromate efflux transporter [Phycisphaerae bacterium]|nr:chromate efflux transporter [Phycisphaerae bacterium]
MDTAQTQALDSVSKGTTPDALPSFIEGLRTWARIGLNSFGGPAGQIAVMHRILVEEKRWISEQRFLHALNYCMLLPGPEAMQLVTYVGWLMHRTLGGLAAGCLFVLPGFVSILALSIAYAAFQDVGIIQALFYGLKSAVLAVVIEAVIRIGKKVLHNRTMIGIAAASFVAIFFFCVPFPIIILATALLGYIGGRWKPASFVVLKGPAEKDIVAMPEILLMSDHTRPPTSRTLRVLVVWLVIWITPLAVIGLSQGKTDIFFQQGVFFSKAAVVTFGGAYSVLAYVAQQAVDTYGWLRPGEMLDGLGMAETTPGPLIQVVQFVGFMGSYRAKPSNPLLAGLFASVVVTWVTYAPCFLYIFLGAPYIEALRGRQSLNATLSAITAAVVGVVLNLALWFGLHTLFGIVTDIPFAFGNVPIPHLASIDLFASAIAISSALALIRFKVGMGWTLAGGVAAGLIGRACGV